MSHLMLPHLVQRELKGFTYKKKLVPQERKYFIKTLNRFQTQKSMVLAWDVYWKEEKLEEFSTKKAAIAYIREKAST